MEAITAVAVTAITEVITVADTTVGTEDKIKKELIRSPCNNGGFFIIRAM